MGLDLGRPKMPKARHPSPRNIHTHLNTYTKDTHTRTYIYIYQHIRHKTQNLFFWPWQSQSVQNLSPKPKKGRSPLQLVHRLPKGLQNAHHAGANEGDHTVLKHPGVADLGGVARSLATWTYGYKWISDMDGHQVVTCYVYCFCGGSEPLQPSSQSVCKICLAYSAVRKLRGLEVGHGEIWDLQISTLFLQARLFTHPRLFLSQVS